MMPEGQMRLLVFNLLTDADDPILGFTTDWLNALAERCAAVDVITMSAGRLAVRDNVQVYSVGRERGYGEARRAWQFYRILSQLLRENQYNACFAHMMPLFSVMGAPLLRAYHIPITLWYTHKSVNWKLRLAEKVSYRVVTASPESFRIPSDKTRVIGHGIDTEQFKPASRSHNPEQPFVVLTVGRIAPVKCLETLLEAARSLYHDLEFHRLRVTIVGEAAPEYQTYEKHLRELVTELRLAEVVEFAGAVTHEQVVHKYQEADVMVNTSKTGSVDKAVLEAMACGLPVVTSNEAFQSMLAPWGDLLVMPPDSPGKLVVSLLKLKEMDTEKRAALGRDLRTIVVQEHSLERLTGKLMNVFMTGEPDGERRPNE